MALIIALGIAVAVVAFVAAPFFVGVGSSERASPRREPGDERRREALEEKEALYVAIHELDFDFKSGKLSAEDHRALREKYERQAALVLARIDLLDGASRAARESGKPRKERRKA
jgi:hypothetical protein